MAGNVNLGAAKASKNDEFYTQWVDIEREMNAYLEYSPDVFRGKIILLPCDDPEWSNFTKYFALNFESLGIKKLISTSYAPQRNGRILVMDKGSKSDGSIVWDYLDGDGDFRSDEVTALRDEADMVITNPPFSLFREFVAWLIEGGVEFSVIGNMNAITYKEIFPLIKDSKIWPGQGFNKAISFSVPDEYFVKEGSEDKDSFGRNIVKVPAISWFTNIEHGRRHEFLELMTMEDNLRFGKKKVIEQGYLEYANYDAIEVPFTMSIPKDYAGVMGVPISFLERYNPDQFEILGTSLELAPPMSDFAKKGTYPTGGPRFYLPNGDGTYRRTYERIAIRHKG